MVNLLTPATQDYLEVILQLSEEKNSVRITDIARTLKVTKASVSQAIDNLKGEGFVFKEKYGPVTLTVKGKEAAVKVKKTHKIIREFLGKVLQVEADVADRDACLIEHVVSPQTIKGMIVFLEKGDYEISMDLDLQKALRLLHSDY